MNVFQKIIEVKKHLGGGFEKDAKKSGKGKELKYDYVTGDQILSRIKDKMNEVGLLFLPNINKGTVKYLVQTPQGDNKIAFGQRYITSFEMTYRLQNADDPQDFYLLEWGGYGQQDEISKAFGSALTYSERYFLLKVFALPTDEDDPDSRQGDNKPEPPKPQTAKETLFALAKSNIDKREQFRAILMTDYVGKKSDELTEEEAAAILKRL